MNKITAKMPHDSLKTIETNILVDEAVASLKEQFSDCHSPSTLVNAMCEAEKLLNDMVEYRCDTFAMLHSECKKGKMQFQLRWFYTYLMCRTYHPKYQIRWRKRINKPCQTCLWWWDHLKGSMHHTAHVWW